MFFQSFESRQRHQFIEDSVDNYAVVLQASETAGFVDETTRQKLQYIVDNLVIPNCKHGVLSMPRRVSDEAIPVWAMFDGESHAVDKSSYWITPHPLQREKQVAYLESQGVMDGRASIDRMFADVALDMTGYKIDPLPPMVDG